MSKAAFKGPYPAPGDRAAGGMGALELALRYSSTDLDFREGDLNALGAADSIRGGQQDIWTLGLNWYAVPGVRFSLNHQTVDIHRLNPARDGDLTPFGPSPETPPPGVEIGQDFQVVSLRTQLSF